MESGFVLIEDSPQRPEASSSALPGPEWALQPYTFRTRIAVPENNAVTKDFERRISKGIIKIVRHDVPEGTILPMDEILARLHKDVDAVTVRNSCVGNDRVDVWQKTCT